LRYKILGFVEEVMNKAQQNTEEAYRKRDEINKFIDDILDKGLE
jgi:hypothetical protein